MRFRNTLSSYGVVAKFFHWLIAVLVICMIVFGFLLEDIPKEYQPNAYNIHKLTGLTILVLMVLRGIWASINPKPLLPFNTPTWQRVAERIVHLLIYVTLIGMPLAGWIGSSAAGRPPHIAGYQLLLPVPQDKALAESALEIHESFAWVLIILLTIHVAAALYHHFIRRDDILRRMLPFTRY